MDPSKIQIPECYRARVLEWMEEFASIAQTEEQKVGWAKCQGLCLMPCATSRHIVFALCQVSDSKMVRALKLERGEGDSVFVSQMIAACNVRPAQ